MCIESVLMQQSDGCRVCSSGEDEAHTLICDECEQPYHMYCLRPKLREVPAGDWFCPECRQAQALRKKSLTVAARSTRAKAAAAAPSSSSSSSSSRGGKKAESKAASRSSRSSSRGKRIEDDDGMSYECPQFC
jgi:hypothetical protein